MSNPQGKNGRTKGTQRATPESPLQSLGVPTQLYKRVSATATKHGLPRSTVVALALEGFFADSAQADKLISKVSIDAEIEGAKRHLANLLNRKSEIVGGKKPIKKIAQKKVVKMKRVAPVPADGAEVVEV